MPYYSLDDLNWNFRFEHIGNCIMSQVVEPSIHFARSGKLYEFMAGKTRPMSFLIGERASITGGIKGTILSLPPLLLTLHSSSMLFPPSSSGNLSRDRIEETTKDPG